ncbi:MAG: site-2 protease family protein [Desulfobulbaceae bacterium]|jgi:Zn-dependent proteases|nr:site-2 protease family protein [Desulfobulbaceae bacterium]
MNFDINTLIQQLAIQLPPLLFALTVHELAHGWVAFRLGDPTAKMAGRLTMNPLKHLDPLGVLAFVIMKIGWAKPVPVDPRYFRNPQKDMLLVALAGPGANVLLALASALLARVLVSVPVLPLFVLQPLVGMLVASVWINIMLAVFNIIPIPPLDGSKVLMGVLPPEAARSFARIEPFGFFILLALFYTGVIGGLILPIIRFANNLLLG